MNVITDEREYTGSGAVLALGMFDGVHVGHRALISRALEIAREENADMMVCTFDRHPLSVVCPEKAPAPLTSTEERLRIFEKLGADWALVRRFTEEFSHVDAREYLENLYKNTKCVCFVSGESYTFGSMARGNADMLREFSREKGIRCEIVKSVKIDSETVSSTRIRKLMTEGNIDEANKLLGKEE